MRATTKALYLALTILTGVGTGHAAQSAASTERTGPLAGLPSAPGPHLEKIKALGENTWQNLGSPAPDPQWGRGLGRAWGCKMPYAPDLRGAFLNGTGVHGFMTSDGRYTDDIWFYDLQAHRWICIYPGTSSKTIVERLKSGELKANEDGQLVDKQGQPVPYAAIPHHSYHMHTYDPDQHKYVIGWGGNGFGGDQYTVHSAWHQESLKLFKEQLQGKTDRVKGTPFYFNTVSGNFERFPSDGTRGQGLNSGLGVFCYLPTKQAYWQFNGGETKLVDAKTRVCSKAGAKGPTPSGIDFGACYDSKRDCIYVGGGSYRAPWGKDEGFLYRYDVQTNTWSNLPNKGRAPTAFGANVACMHYDAANDRVLHFVHTDSKTAGLYVFDPETAAWEAEPLPLGAGVSTQLCWHGFYAPELNAHFLFLAGDSSNGGPVWVYRYKHAEEKEKVQGLAARKP